MARKRDSQPAGALLAATTCVRRVSCLAVLMALWPASGCTSSPLMSSSASLAPMLDGYHVTNKDRRDRFPTAAEAGL